jgi:hypothetical protein
VKYYLSLRFHNETGVWCKGKPAQLGPGGYGRRKGRENIGTCLNFLFADFSLEKES